MNDSKATTVSAKFLTRPIIALFCKTWKQNAMFKHYISIVLLCNLNLKIKALQTEGWMKHVLIGNHSHVGMLF